MCLLATDFSFPRLMWAACASYSVIRIPIGAEIKMIESLRPVMSLCSDELQSIGALKGTRGGTLFL